MTALQKSGASARWLYIGVFVEQYPRSPGEEIFVLQRLQDGAQVVETESCLALVLGAIHWSGKPLVVQRAALLKYNHCSPIGSVGGKLTG